MKKHIFAAIFSAMILIVIFPPTMLTVVQAWLSVMLMYGVGVVLAIWASEKKRRRKRRRKSDE